MRISSLKAESGKKRSASDLLDKVISILIDGKWHEKKEIYKRVNHPPRATGVILTFLSKFMFIEIEEKKHRVRVKPSIIKYLKKL